jgi:hypothetical protein
MAKISSVSSRAKNADQGKMRASGTAMSRVPDAVHRELAERRRGAVTLVDSTVDLFRLIEFGTEHNSKH